MTKAFGNKKLTAKELAKAEQNMYGYEAAKALNKAQGKVTGDVTYNIRQGIASKWAPAKKIFGEETLGHAVANQTRLTILKDIAKVKNPEYLKSFSRN